MSDLYEELVGICGPDRVSDKLADRICYTWDCGPRPGEIREWIVRLTAVVCNCPCCLKTFKHDAPESLGRRLPFEPLHFLGLTANMAETVDLKFEPVSPKSTVTHHDSCTMGRWRGTYAAPRILLQHVPGVAIRETRRSREYGCCCGARGLIRFDHVGMPNAQAKSALQKQRPQEPAC